MGLRAIGIPTSMFTVMFAMARCVGWFSHWHEMTKEDQMRIGRPRQLYVGEKLRSYVDVKSRSVPADEIRVTEVGDDADGGRSPIQRSPTLQCRGSNMHTSVISRRGSVPERGVLPRQGSVFIQKMVTRDQFTGSSFKKAVPDDDTRHVPEKATSPKQ